MLVINEIKIPVNVIQIAEDTKKENSKDLVLISTQGNFIKHQAQSIRVTNKGELGTIGLNIKNNKTRIISTILENKYIADGTVSLLDIQNSCPKVARYRKLMSIVSEFLLIFLHPINRSLYNSLS